MAVAVIANVGAPFGWAAAPAAGAFGDCSTHTPRSPAWNVGARCHCTAVLLGKRTTTCFVVGSPLCTVFTVTTASLHFGSCSLTGLAGPAARVAAISDSGRWTLETSPSTTRYACATRFSNSRSLRLRVGSAVRPAIIALARAGASCFTDSTATVLPNNQPLA